MKGAIKQDHMPLNKYKLLIVGIAIPELTVTALGGVEEEIDNVELPDRTRASGGTTKPSEFTAKIPMHHQLEKMALDIWFQEGKEPVSPGYKKAGTIIYPSLTDANQATYAFSGAFITKRTLPDAEMANEGEMAEVEYTISIDEIYAVT